MTEGSISVSLSVTASASSGTINYRWYENSIYSNLGGTEISGVNTSSFTIPTTLTAANKPKCYYCILSHASAPSVVTNVAKVTIFELIGGKFMIDKITYLETDSEKFPLAFTLNVTEALQDEYGTLSEWSELIRNKKEPNIKALKFFITEAINEGIDIENGSRYAAPSGRYRCADEQEKTQRIVNENEQGDNVFDREIRRKFVTMKEAGRIITEIGLKKVANIITKMITESMPHNEKSKKVKTTKNQKI